MKSISFYSGRKYPYAYVQIVMDSLERRDLPLYIFFQNVEKKSLIDRSSASLN